MAKNKDRKPNKANIWKGPEQPTDEEKKEYSKKILLYFRENTKQEEDKAGDTNAQLNQRIKTINKSLIEAAEDTLKRRKPVDRDFKWSEEVTQLFKERQKSHELGDHKRAKQQTKEIRNT